MWKHFTPNPQRQSHCGAQDNFRGPSNACLYKPQLQFINCRLWTCFKHLKEHFCIPHLAAAQETRETDVGSFAPVRRGLAEGLGGPCLRQPHCLTPQEISCRTAAAGRRYDCCWIYSRVEVGCGSGSPCGPSAGRGAHCRRRVGAGKCLQGCRSSVGGMGAEVKAIRQ